MKVYITDKQVPELSNFKLWQRSIIRDGAFDLFCKEHRGAPLWVPLGNGIAAGISALLASTVSHRPWAQMVLTLTLVFVIVTFCQSMLTERLRPYFRRYIEESRDARLVR